MQKKEEKKWNDSDYLPKEGCLLQTSTLSLYIYIRGTKNIFQWGN